MEHWCSRLRLQGSGSTMSLFWKNRNGLCLGYHDKMRTAIATISPCLPYRFIPVKACIVAAPPSKSIAVTMTAAKRLEHRHWKLSARGQQLEWRASQKNTFKLWYVRAVSLPELLTVCCDGKAEEDLVSERSPTGLDDLQHGVSCWGFALDLQGTCGGLYHERVNVIPCSTNMATIVLLERNTCKKSGVYYAAKNYLNSKDSKE